MLLEDIKKLESIKLDIACGVNKKEGYIGLDLRGNPDITCDLTQFPWIINNQNEIFEDNSVDSIHCSHYVEHTKDLIGFMDECWRILKVGGQMIVQAPYYSSHRAWQDPTHLRAISEMSFLYFNREWRRVNLIEHYNIKSDFDFTFGYLFNPMWISRSQEARDFAVKHYINVVDDIQVVLTKKKQEESK